MSGVEVLVDADFRLETLRLPRALVARVADIVAEENLGYGSFRDFVLAAVRCELERAEKTAFFLREGAR